MKLEELTPKWLIDRYCYGLELVDSYGKEFPLERAQIYIDSSIDWLENQLDIVIRPRLIQNETYDFDRSKFIEGFGYMRTRKRPIKEILKVEFRIGNIPMGALDMSWITVDKKFGQLNLIPPIGVGGAFILTTGQLIPYITRWENVPQFIVVDYIAGLDEIDSMMADAIGWHATIELLNVFGELVLGAGISRLELDMDGLRQEIDSTASAMYHAFSARVHEAEGILYGKTGEKTGLIDMLKKVWHTINIM